MRDQNQGCKCTRSFLSVNEERRSNKWVYIRQPPLKQEVQQRHVLRTLSFHVVSLFNLPQEITASTMRAQKCLYSSMCAAVILHSPWALQNCCIHTCALPQFNILTCAWPQFWDGGHKQLISSDGRFKPAFAKRDRKQEMIGYVSALGFQGCGFCILNMRTAANNSLPGIRQGPSTWRPCALPRQNQQCGDNGRRCPPTGLLLQNKLFKMAGCGAVNPELRARIRI